MSFEVSGTTQMNSFNNVSLLFCSVLIRPVSEHQCAYLRHFLPEFDTRRKDVICKPICRLELHSATPADQVYNVFCFR